MTLYVIETSSLKHSVLSALPYNIPLLLKKNDTLECGYCHSPVPFLF
ncbi:MAG: hypothetical protein J6B34_05690 [Clostridia bacterium]|nr:hypothetical protein [Clostridia bacterium]